jgi:micrococcal nuclease
MPASLCLKPAFMKPSHTKKKPPLLAFFFLVMLVLFTAFGNHIPILSFGIKTLQRQFETNHVQGLEGPISLVRVTDGDTLVLEIGRKEEKVRLIGVDTPEKYSSDKLERDLETSGLSEEEMKRLGEQATKVTTELLKNKDLYLELDTSARDRYGRLLVYVYYADSQGTWVFDKQTFKQLNFELVKLGWADVLTVPPNVKYAEAYLKQNQEARAKKWGMWKIY